MACHNHLPPPGEVARFLFETRAEVFRTSVFEQVLKAWHSKEAVYDLPYTVAEGLAARHRIPREQFLARIQPRKTQAEEAADAEGRRRRHRPGPVAADENRPLRALANGPWEGLFRGLHDAAAAVLRRTPMVLGRVAAVLDNSYTTSGTQEKKRRPLGVAWAVDRLPAASREYRAFWTHPFEGVMPKARGATDLATPILDALETLPEMRVIVTDAVENDPPGGAAARAYARERS